MEEGVRCLSGLSELTGAITKTISSIIGPKAASAFLTNVSQKKIISGREVVLNFQKARKTLEGYQIHQLSIVNDGIYRFLELEKVPQKDIKTAAENVEAYFDWLTTDRKEAAAHFANIFTQDTYPQAVRFLSLECKLLVMSMMVYVKGINV